MRVSVFLFGLLGLLAGCRGLDVVDLLTPTAGYRGVETIGYGPHARHRLDLYHPDQEHGAMPILVFFYGGSWQTGDRADYRFIGQTFASAGMVVAIPDYRLWPEVRHHGFLEDAAQAVAAVATRYPTRSLVLVGHSAGAYIAAMVAMDPRWAQRVGLDRCRIAGFVGLSGPYEFLPVVDPVIAAILGPGEPDALTQPAHHADAESPPALLIHGERDDVVLPENSRWLRWRLDQSGVPVRLRLHPGAGHLTTVAALTEPLRFTAPVRDEVLDFLTTLPHPRTRCGTGLAGATARPS
ncbi:MAG: alpha/beta hydrolase [Alphaproteobacteria bacterium]|nr:MAG: alpha/beta hydrolase [Alphaproteobacteria bacterium]